MQGSTALFIVVPIVLPAALFAWLGLVFWAGAHPGWKAHRVAPELPGTAVELPGTVVQHRAGTALEAAASAPHIRPRQAA